MVYILLGAGFEEAEALVTADVLRRADIPVTLAGIGGELIVTAFQSASGLVNIVTPTAAVVMGGLALGDVPYDRWVKFVWKLILIFFLLTIAFLMVSAVL